MVEKVLDEDRRGGYEVAEGFPPLSRKSRSKDGAFEKNKKSSWLLKLLYYNTIINLLIIFMSFLFIFLVAYVAYCFINLKQQQRACEEAEKAYDECFKNLK